MTWVLYPPSTSGVLWFAIAVLFFYYPIGTSLERTIGTFKYTLYILSGRDILQFWELLIRIFGGNVLVGNVFSTYYISCPHPCICNVIRICRFCFVYHSGEDEVDGIFGVVIVVYEMIQYIMAGAWYLVIPIVLLC